MEITIKLKIAAVYSGFFHKGDPRYTEKFGYWVEVRQNDTPHDTIWRETYTALQLAVSNKYGLKLPKEGDKLHWMNYGTPFNIAIL